MSSIGQIWISLWLLRKRLLESMSLYGKFKIKNFWARNMMEQEGRLNNGHPGVSVWLFVWAS